MIPATEGSRQPGGGAPEMSEGDRSQLEWEARAARAAAAAALGAALLPLIGRIVSISAVSDAEDTTAGLLQAIDDGSAGFLIGGIITALGTLLLPVALGYLYRATLARRPQAPRFALPLLIAAAVAVAVLTVLEQIFLIDAASDFVAGGDGSEAAADEAFESGAAQTARFVQVGLRVALGASIIIIALNAMRAGLLGRFMGIIGVGVGGFFVLPILDPVLIGFFWAVALSLLYLGRWPGGERGPAWSRVEAVPWPSAADRMEAQRRARVEEAQTEAGEAPSAGDGPAATEDGRGAAAEGPGPRPTSRKRRRGR